MALFKKKITDVQAVSIFVMTIIEQLNEGWEETKRGFEDITPLSEIDDGNMKFEIALAAMALDLIALKKLFPVDRANHLYNLFLRYIVTVEDVGEYAKETISDEYIPYINNAMNNNENPLPKVASILYQKLNIEPLEDGFYSPITLLALSAIVVSFAGVWKRIDDKFKITV